MSIWLLCNSPETGHGSADRSRVVVPTRHTWRGYCFLLDATIEYFQDWHHSLLLVAATGCPESFFSPCFSFWNNGCVFLQRPIAKALTSCFIVCWVVNGQAGQAALGVLLAAPLHNASVWQGTGFSVKPIQRPPFWRFRMRFMEGNFQGHRPIVSLPPVGDKT